MLLLIVLNPRLPLGENALALSIEIDTEATGGAGPMTTMRHFRRSARAPHWSGEPQRPDVRSLLRHVGVAPKAGITRQQPALNIAERVG